MRLLLQVSHVMQVLTCFSGQQSLGVSAEVDRDRNDFFFSNDRTLSVKPEAPTEHTF